MTNACFKLQAETRKLNSPSVTRIEEVFAPWVNLPGNFGRPARKRLFFPLTHLLAVPRTGPLQGPIVQRDPADLPRMARLRAR